jgi:hypothetical protein
MKDYSSTCSTWGIVGAKLLFHEEAQCQDQIQLQGRGGDSLCTLKGGRKRRLGAVFNTLSTRAQPARLAALTSF